MHRNAYIHFSCNNVALPYFTFGYLSSPRNIKILKIGDGYVIAANIHLCTSTKILGCSLAKMTSDACLNDTYQLKLNNHEWIIIKM